MPKVSIIIPVYKVEKYLDQCVNSVRQQTLADIEIILVDDGSPDNCPQMIDAYAKQDSRIVAIHQKNTGLGGARNTGLKAASGEYVAFVDSDDWVSVDFCESMYNRAKQTNADLTLIGETLYFEDKAEYGPGWRDFRNKTNVEVLNQQNFLNYFTPAWGRLYKLEYLKANRLKFVEKCYYEDNSWGCYFILLKASVAFAGNLYFYRQHSQSITAKKDIKVLDFVRDCEYFHSTINEIKVDDQQLKLCRLFYLLNFYNYYPHLDRDVQKTFLARVRKVTADWDINLTDISHLTADKETQVKIYCFLKGLNPKKVLKAIQRAPNKLVRVYLLKIIQLLKIEEFDYKTRYLLFGFLPVLKKTKTGNKTKYLLFGFLPILKIK